MKPELDSRIKGHKGYGLIQVITGNGKGKTTSAIGQAVRTVGAGKRAAIVFFDKGGEHYSERGPLEKLGIDFWAFGRDRIDPESGRFDFSVTEEDRELGKKAIQTVKELMHSRAFDLIVLDEINSSADLGIVDEDSVLGLLGSKPATLEVILTGRNAPNSFKQKAHLVTEVKPQKHYFYSGVKAREGLDY